MAIPSTPPSSITSGAQPHQGGIPFTDAVEIIRDRIDIVDIIGRKVMLKRQGRNYVGLCPFHSDKNPSFSVNREKNLYKCFSCGEGGDAFSFVMKQNGRTFGEVVEEFADELGITIARGNKSSEERQQERDEKQRILKLNEAAQQFYTQQLASPAGQETVNYLHNRGLTPDTCQRFGLGFAPPGWENLANNLRHHQHATTEDLIAAGLASQSQQSPDRVYDRFRYRLMIPIHNDRGQVVAFGGRQLDKDDNGPKYLNSPETPVYHKSNVLYGLTADALKTKQHAIIMEGYFDVMAAHQAGFTESVAVCGTALTESHIRLLRRYDVDSITLCLDSDEAGQRATQQAIATLAPFPIKVNVLVIPDAKDPADIIQQIGGEGFKQLLAKHHVDSLTYQCQQAVNGYALQTSDGKANAVAALAPLIGRVSNPVKFREYVTHWANKLGIYTDDLFMACQPYRPATHYTTPAKTYKKKNTKKSGYTSSNKAFRSNLSTNAHQKPVLKSKITALEGKWLALLFMNKDSYNLMLPRLASRRLESPFAQWCQNWLQQYLSSTEGNSVTSSIEGVIARMQQAIDSQQLNDASESDLPLFANDFANLRVEAAQLADQWDINNSDDPVSLSRRLTNTITHLDNQLTHAQRLASLNPLIEAIKEQETPVNETLATANSELTLNNDELALIELQYAFRDKLTKPTEPNS